MKLFTYLSWQYLKIVIGTTLALGTFSLIIDVMEHLRRLSKVNTGGTATAFQLSAFKTPDLILELAPFIILLATLFSFYTLSKNRELVALRSMGIPARRFVLPALFVLTCISLFNVLILSPFAAVLQKTYEKQEAALFPNMTQGLITGQGELWLKQPNTQGETFIFARGINANGTELSNVTLFQFDENNTFKNRMDSAKMTYQFSRKKQNNSQAQTYWQLQDVYHFQPQTIQNMSNISNTHLQFTATEVWETTLTPATIANSAASPKTMPVWELYPFIQTLETAGLSTTQHVLYLHKNLALPAFFLGMFLLAVPFGVRFNRRQSMGRVFIIGITLGFLFFMLNEIAASYGLSGRLSPIVAAWLPAVVAALTGLGLLIFYREE